MTLLLCFQCKPETKAEEMNVALEEKLKAVEKVYIHELSSSLQLYTASPLQLIVKVLMIDGSSKALMVDEGQTVREVLGKLFEKTHCVYSIDWSLSEINPELQTGETITHRHVWRVLTKSQGTHR